MTTTIRPELIDELLAEYEKPEDLLGNEGLFKQLKKALLERALGTELSTHLAYEKSVPAGRGTGNGYSDKTVLTEDGALDIAVPRDRNGTFEPVIVPKGERRLDGFDDYRVAICAWHDGARDSRPSARALWRRGLAGSDQPGHRRRARGSPRMAEPAAGCGLPAAGQR